MTTFNLRLHGNHLAPAFQDGDALVCEEATHAENGQLAIVVLDDGEAGARRYDPEQGWQVIGVVVEMGRKIAGAESV